MGPDVEAAELEPHRPLLTAARKLIERNYAQPLTPSRIARHVGMSPRWLQRDFQAVYGESLKSYLKRCRMQAADRLLAEGGDPHAVALLVGYHLEHSFVMDYKRWFGHLPGARSPQK